MLKLLSAFKGVCVNEVFILTAPVKMLYCPEHYQVMQGQNIVADRWAGASNPHPHPKPCTIAAQRQLVVSSTRALLEKCLI